MKHIFYPVVQNITKEERFQLFDILDNEFLKGNYKVKAKELEISVSYYFYFRRREQEISDEKALWMLTLLYNKNQNKFEEYIVPIIKRVIDEHTKMLEEFQLTQSASTTTELKLEDDIGFTAPPDIQIDFFKRISMNGKLSVRIYMDSEKVWFDTKNEDLHSLGFFDYNYPPFKDCYGKGGVKISAKTLLNALKDVKGHDYPEVTFHANPRTKKFWLTVRNAYQSEDFDIIDSVSKISFDFDSEYNAKWKNYIVLGKIQQLKNIAYTAKQSPTVTLISNPPTVNVSYQGVDKILVIPKPRTDVVVLSNMELTLPLTSLKAVAEVFVDSLDYYSAADKTDKNKKGKGKKSDDRDVTASGSSSSELRFKENEPVLFVKKENYGTLHFVSAVLIGTMIPKPKHEKSESLIKTDYRSFLRDKIDLFGESISD